MTEAEHPLLSLLATFRLDGRQFERLCKWYLENDPASRAEYREIWLWRDWPGCWGRDRGIDLIAERHSGEIVAVQAKNYGCSHSITKRDVDTFLSESNRRDIHSRLLVGTTDRVARSAHDVMRAQEKPVETRLLNDLLEAPVTWPRPGEEFLASELEQVTPRPDQQEALDAIAAWASDCEGRAQVIRACGTGKTLIGIWAAEQLAAERVLVLVPTNPLLRQMVTTWTQHSTTSRRVLRVCSDRTSDEEVWDHGDELGTSRTTDPAEIASSLRAAGPLLVLCTYASSRTLAEAMAEAPDIVFDLAIADEAHRLAGAATSTEKTVLRDDTIRARHRLFMTATPTVYGLRDKDRAADRNIQLSSMDDEALFGPVIHHFSFAEAIRRELLCPYQVAVIPIDDDEVREMVSEHTLVTPDGDEVVDAASLATQVACVRAMSRYGCRRMVAFHPRIVDSKRFSKQFPLAVSLLEPDHRPAGAVWAEHVDGRDMRHAVRAQRVREFKDDDEEAFRVLSNVRLLAEGVDVPGIDSIVFVDSERGQAAIIQAVGRAVRPAPGKTIGTVVLPIVTRSGESFADALQRSEHRTIVKVLRALRSHDPEIVRSLDELRFAADPTAGKRLPAVGRFVVDVPVEVGDEFAEAVDVALADVLGVHSKRWRERAVSESRQLETAPPPPTVSFRFWDHLRELATLARHELLPHLPSGDGWPDRSEWWPELMGLWEQDELSAWDKRAVADAISWLSPDFENYPRQRAEVFRLTSYSLADQVLSQLRLGGIDTKGSLAGLAEEELSRDVLIGPTEALHRGLTHAAMPIKELLKNLREGLGHLASAVEASHECRSESDAYSWRWPPAHVTSALQGFRHELELARVGERGFETEPTAPKTRLKRAEKAGRAAAEPLLERVGALRAFRSPGDEEAVRRRREDEDGLEPDERLDQLGWEIFVLSMARGFGVDEAAKQGLSGTFRERQAVRDDVLARTERELHQAAESHVVPATRSV